MIKLFSLIFQDAALLLPPASTGEEHSVKQSLKKTTTDSRIPIKKHKRLNKLTQLLTLSVYL
jgi:hypothetical protein